MVNKSMILFAKRLRSKAPSAATLSPVQFADRQGIDFISCQLFSMTPSLEGEGKPTCPALGLLIGRDRGRGRQGWEEEKAIEDPTPIKRD